MILRFKSFYPHYSFQPARNCQNLKSLPESAQGTSTASLLPFLPLVLKDCVGGTDACLENQKRGRRNALDFKVRRIINIFAAAAFA